MAAGLPCKYHGVSSFPPEGHVTPRSSSERCLGSMGVVSRRPDAGGLSLWVVETLVCLCNALLINSKNVLQVLSLGFLSFSFIYVWYVMSCLPYWIICTMRRSCLVVFYILRV